MNGHGLLVVRLMKVGGGVMAAAALLMPGLMLGGCGSSSPKTSQAAGPLLETIEYQRQYTGAPLAEGTKSISFRLTVGAADRTLSSDEVTAIRNGIIEAMRGDGYELRV